MRTHLFRGVMALAVLLTVSAVPALAQSVVRGKVTDATGKPVADATVLFEATDANRKTQTKTDKNGEFLQVGLSSGAYKVTASKDGVGTETKNTNVRQGPNNPLSFALTASSGLSTQEKQDAVALQAAAGAAMEAMKAGRHDEAIAKFNEVLVKMPTCSDCYYNLGLAYVGKQDLAQAETAFKKAIELKPASPEAYTGLAGIYNTQKKFDLAAEASSKAAELSGGAAGGGGAEASYNQGVILFNAGKFAEAKTQFEAATKADPNLAMAQYQLGMTALNLGQIPDAVAALEAYLKVDPNGPKAAEVKQALPALQGMLKKKSPGFPAPGARRGPGLSAMSPHPSDIASHLAEVRQRIADAAISVGRDPSSVRLIAVSKTFPIEAILEAFAAGQRDFGENKVQEGLQKFATSADLPIRWHLLGHLQTNKARKAASAFAMIQSVDSVELLEKLDRAAAESGHTPELLIQVDLAGETTKFGAPPDEVPRLFDAAAACRAANVVGLMTLPPIPDTPEEARPWFRRLRDLCDGWLASGVPAPMLRELSMGMSGDFEVAIQEGATMVRVGTAIFGSRHVEQ